jgi:L-fucose isomerase-like protein
MLMEVKMSIKKSVDMKLNVKPLFINLEHEGPHPERAQDININSAYEGPCRLGEGEMLTNAYDKKMGVETFKKFAKAFDEYPDYVNVKTPEYLHWTDSFIVKDKMYEDIKDELNDTDIILADGVLKTFPLLKIAEKANVAAGDIGCCSADFSAGARANGVEGYGFIDHEHVKRFAPLLRTKKAMLNTRVLYVVKDMTVPYGSVCNIEPSDMKSNLHVNYRVIGADTLLDACRNLTNEQKREVEEKTDELVDGAAWSEMTRDNVRKSVVLYVAVKGLLDKYDCNAFTMPCHEVCATRKFNDEFQFTPCLTHSLLKEDGIPSGCECDLNSLLAIVLLENLTMTAPHMGNTGPYYDPGYLHPETGDFSVPKGLPPIPVSDEDRENVFYTFHAVQTRKQKGLKKPNASYGLKSFTRSGWGATIRANMKDDVGEKITLVRFSPDAKKMLVISGEIIAEAGNEEYGCGNGIYWKCKDGRDAFWKQQNFGHHMAWVYGDYKRDIMELGDMMGIEVITA